MPCSTDSGLFNYITEARYILIVDQKCVWRVSFEDYRKLVLRFASSL